MVKSSRHNEEWLMLSPPIARLWAMEQAADEQRLWTRLRRHRSRGAETNRSDGTDGRT